MKKLIWLFGVTVLFTLVTVAKEPYKAGDFAADFKLRNINGNMVSLSQFGDTKGFIVVFMCNTCPVVKKYEHRIMDLHKQFSEKGYPVIAINSNDKDVSPGDSFEAMQKLASNKEYRFEYLYDESQDVARIYGATNTPHVFVLTKLEGKLKIEYSGAIDNNADDELMADKHYVEDVVNAILNGAQAPVAGTKAIGCTIKWKRI